MTLDHDHAAHEHDDEGHDHGDDEHDHSGHQHVDYPTAVTMYRADKDEYFRESHGSPIVNADRPSVVVTMTLTAARAVRMAGPTSWR